MRKLSKRHRGPLTKLSKRSSPDIDKYVQQLKEKVKKDPEIIRKFKKYDVPIDEIDNVHVEFKDLDVSAKTKNKKIYLNSKMLSEDSPVKDPAHYLVHELIHYLQQSTGNTDDKKHQKEYLDRETEQEAFQSQVDYKKREESEEEAEEYVEGLLDHHDVDGKEREEKKDDLLGE